MRFRLVIITVFTGALFIACNTNQKPAGSITTVSSPTPKTASPQIPTVHADGVRRITTVELKDLLAKNEAVVVDVRTEASFKQGHIPGARLIPVADVLLKTDQLPKNKLIVTYCS